MSADELHGPERGGSSSGSRGSFWHGRRHGVHCSENALESTGMDVSERYEQLIAYLNSNLPAPVEQAESEAGVRQFFGGDPVEVVARLTDTSVTVSEFAGCLGVDVHVHRAAAARRRVELAAAAGERAAVGARSAHQGRPRGAPGVVSAVPGLRTPHGARGSAGRRHLPGLQRPAHGHSLTANGWWRCHNAIPPLQLPPAERPRWWPRQRLPPIYSKAT